MDFSEAYRINPKEACTYRYSVTTCMFFLKAFHKCKKDEIGKVLFDTFGIYVCNKTNYSVFRDYKYDALYYYDLANTNTHNKDYEILEKQPIRRICIYSVLLSILSKSYMNGEISREKYIYYLSRFEFSNTTYGFGKKKTAFRKKKSISENNSNNKKLTYRSKNNRRIKIIYTPMGCGKNSK